jgi:hypothetical protein
MARNPTLLKTPVSHGAVLITPDQGMMHKQIEENRRSLSGALIKVLNHPLNTWRAECRQDLLQKALQYTEQLGLPVPSVKADGPWLVTGHQCQFNHCGILIKYLLLHRLAEQNSGVALNLVVDSDLPKNMALRLPNRLDDRLTVSGVSFENLPANIPTEYLKLPSTEQIEIFTNKAKALAVPQFLSEPLNRSLKSLARAHEAAVNLTDFFTILNREMAKFLGTMSWLELPVSQMAETTAFLAFAADMIMHACRTREAYNTALDDYRHKKKIRHISQPLPNLSDTAEGGTELPFWLFQTDKPRQALFVRESNNELVFNAESMPAFRIAIKDLENPDSLRDLFVQHNCSLRPRALTLSIFARLFLGDFFIHGLGGALYEQISDRFIRDYYNLPPPHFATASATLHLPFEGTHNGDGLNRQIRRVSRQLRDLRFNPQRYLPDSPAAGQAEQVHLRETQIQLAKQLREDKAPARQRSETFMKIHELNDSLFRSIEPVQRQYQVELESLQSDLQQYRLTCDREFYFGLFDSDHLNLLREKINAN